MEIHGDLSKLTIDPKLQPLFDAMKEGKRIKSITCMKGNINKDNRDKDFTIENVKATDFFIGYGISNNIAVHYIVTNNPDESFYIGWVLNFEL